MRPIRFTSPQATVIADDTADAVLTPLTGAYPTASIEDMVADLWLGGLTGSKYKLVAQFSDDAVTWNSTLLELSSNYISTVGWTQADYEGDLHTTAGTDTRLYVRFGVIGRLDSAGPTQTAQARIRVRAAAVQTATVAGPSLALHTLGSSTKVFLPSSQVVPTEGLANARRTVRVDSVTEDVTVWVGFQTTDTPDDPTSWSAITTISAGRTTVGVSFAQQFSAVTFAGRFARFGIVVANSANSDIEAAVAAFSVDLRS
ncbi:MAG: hypothetical protein ACI9K2_007360 [Myxococcota bacterium]|jgi:hypothetical protein